MKNITDMILKMTLHSKTKTKQDSKGALVIVLAGAALIIMIFAALTTGRYPVSMTDIFDIISGRLHMGHKSTDGAADLVLFSVRMPRILAAIFVGAALSGSGACYQGIFRNPMVEPSLLGVTAGAALGAALGILFSASIAEIQAMSFIMGLTAVLITSGMSSVVNRKGDSTLAFILCGIITGTLFTAFLSLVKYTADPDSKLPAITYWLMGSLATVNMKDISVSGVLIIAGLIPLMFLRWRINVMAFGDEEARSLGVNTAAVRVVVIASSTLMTAAAVSISGMIGWIGLVIPHLARMIVGPSFPVLLPASVLMGAFFLLFVDTIARIAFPIEIPLGILTAIAGAPFFFFLLAYGKRGWI